jgi:Na+/glutamate symporter
MPWWLIGSIGCFVGLVIGGILGILVASWCFASYKDDEKHGRQEWQQGARNDWHENE